ncbi:hypothetical protein AB6A40_006132 [Gnathostoma spinigerum]|uniref:Dolichyl-diphosphooligosaccharide--protein glycosyltransferase subunit 2 n=1 Tax=Gnathostoma spinigerum TaxID=75299 RepID=A0ABD6EQY5_9BILA
MRLLSATVLLLMAECVFCAIPFLNTYLDPASKESLIKVFLEAVESKELNAIHHAVSGLRTLGVQVDAAKSKVICEMVQKTPVADLTKLYHVVGIISELKNCAQPTISSAKELIDAAPKATKLKTSDLYLALFAANKLRMKGEYP